MRLDGHDAPGGVADVEDDKVGAFVFDLDRVRRVDGGTGGATGGGATIIAVVQGKSVWKERKWRKEEDYERNQCQKSRQFLDAFSHLFKMVCPSVRP